MEATKLVITNMCLIKDDRGHILFQNRCKNDWPGLTFPGGHLKINESIEESVIREVKEETNLDIKNPKLIGIHEWFYEKTHEITFLFMSSNYSGFIQSNDEGESSFYDLKDIKKEDLSNDFDKILLKYDIRI